MIHILRGQGVMLGDFPFIEMAPPTEAQHSCLAILGPLRNLAWPCGFIQADLTLSCDSGLRSECTARVGVRGCRHPP